MRLVAVLLFAAVFVAGQEAEKSAAPPAQAAPPASTAATSTPAPSAQQSSAQAPAPRPPAVPMTVLKVTTRLVLVDVVVTDSSGKPVVNLKSPDFEVRENGKPQKIVGFSFQQPPPASAAYTPMSLPEGVFTNLRNLGESTGPPTILLVDALNTPFKDQPYLRQQLVKYLKNVEPRRNVAIYTLGTRLRLIQDFTSDPELLRAAMQKITGHSSMFNGEQQSVTEEFPGLDPDSSDQSTAQMAQSLIDFEAEAQAFQRDLQVRITMEAMQELARNVAGYPGRKNLVWLSASFPLTVFPDETSNNPFAVQRQYGDDLRKTAALFSADQIAVYPVDARGLVAGFMPDASQSGSSFVGARGGRNAVRAISQGSANLAASHDTMNELAGQTGGRAFYNRNDIDHAIALSVAEGSTYYTLAYYPSDKDLNGKFRKIEVKIDRKGVQSRYRKGYFGVDAKPADNQLARREFYNSLAPEAPIANELPFIVRVTPPAKDGKEKDVWVDFSVVPDAIFFQAQGELQHAQLTFVTRAYDTKGKPVGDPKSETISTQLKPATYADIMKRGFRLRESIKLPPGKYILKLGVRDEQSNMMGTLAAKVSVEQGS